jgi:hypothetical protein
MPEPDEPAEMPCSCGGNNSNCSRCYGSGYVRRPPGWTGKMPTKPVAGLPMEEYERRPWVPPVETPEEQGERRRRGWRLFWFNLGVYALPFALVFLFLRACR